MPQRNCICICFLTLILSLSRAEASSPVLEGLAGAGRSGIPESSIFLNPAAIGILQNAISFFNYSKTRINDFNAGGKDYSLGIYDTTNTFAHAGFAYERESRATVTNNGAQGYADNSKLRFGLARELADGLIAGVTPRYVINKSPSGDTKFFTGDAGIIFNLAADMRAGITYENASQQVGERPPTLAGGLNYGLGFGVGLYGDYGSAMQGPLKNNKLWSLGAELAMFSDIVLRGGLYRDAIIGQRGAALGLSWAGPRLGLDFAMKTTYYAPIERDVSFGLVIKM